MKVLIVNNMTPFIWGGAEELAFHLQRNIIKVGHESEILRIPFQYDPAMRILGQMLMVRSLDLINVDFVIALKFPAYLIRHPRKTLWLLHQYRQAYELYDSGLSNIPGDSDGEALRNMIQEADNESFAESRHIFSNSKITKERLKKYNGFAAEVLLPPVNDPELFTGKGGADYIYAGGRVNDFKRQHLLLDAMKYADKSVNLIIAGPPDCPEDALRLEQMVERANLADRVKLDLRFLPRHAYAEYINNAAAVAYLPFDEDSLGYVAMEAATAGKALITTPDSGGVLGLVKDGVTGWVASPEKSHLADVMNAVFNNMQQTKRYGLEARALWNSMGVTWPQTVERLLK